MEVSALSDAQPTVAGTHGTGGVDGSARRGPQSGPARSLRARLAGILAGAGARSFPDDLSGEGELRRYLDWCRRYEEPAHLLVIRVPGPCTRLAGTAREIFRCSDGVALRRVGGALELRALLADRGLDREAVERRVRDSLGAQAKPAWAHFPEDAVTIDTLVEAARGRLGAAAQPEQSHRAATPNGRLRLAPAVAEEKYADA